MANRRFHLYSASEEDVRGVKKERIKLMKNICAVHGCCLKTTECLKYHSILVWALLCKLSDNGLCMAGVSNDRHLLTVATKRVG